jgi:hypothetical protein
MEIDNKKILIGAGVLVIGYLVYKSMKNKPTISETVVNAVVVPKPLTEEEQEALNEVQEALNEEQERKNLAKQAIIDAEDRASSLAGR